MNKLLIVLVAVMFVTVFQTEGYGTTQMDESTEITNQMHEMVAVMKNHGITINEWSIYARDDNHTILDKGKYRDKVTSLQNQFPHLKWEQSAENGIFKTVGMTAENKQHGALTTKPDPMNVSKDTNELTNQEQTNQQSTIKEQMIYVAYPYKDQFKTYLIYLVTGETWTNGLMIDFLPVFQNNILTLFDKYPQLFSCIKGQTDDMMEGVLYNQALTILKDFSANPIESLREETFVSVSAYNKNWNNSIPEKNKEMNIQIAIRNDGLGGASTVVIGTPIITTEY